MKKILIVAPYSSLPGDKFVNRFAFLANYFSEIGHKVTFVTSSFSHSTKKHRKLEPADINPKINTLLIDELGYKSHVGIGRINSIRSFVRNFKSAFNDFDDFDIVYSAYPLISHNLHIVDSINHEKTKYIVDVQDVWPESFSAVIPAIRHLNPRVLPFARSANKVYSAADGLISVSKTYLERALQENFGCKSLVAYIGTEFSNVDSTPPSNGPIKLFYVGTISHSYDVITVMRAVDSLVKEGNNIEFHIFGHGPDTDKLTRTRLRNSTFHGLVPYRELEANLRDMHIAVNALAKGAPQSVTNKLCDYLGLGCPIINSQSSREVTDILASRLHANYKAGDVKSAKESIRKIISDGSVFNTWNFDRSYNRHSIADDIARFVDSF